MRRLGRGDAPGKESADDLEEFCNRTRTHVNRRHRQQHLLGKEDDEADQHGRSGQCQTRFRFPDIEFLEAEVPHGTDHQKRDQKDQQTPQEGRPDHLRRRFEEVHDGSDHSGPHRNRQAYKIAFGICIHRPLRLHIETRQTKCPAYDEGKSRKKTELKNVVRRVAVEALDFTEKKAEGQNGRSDSKRDDIGERIELHPEFARCFSKPGDAAIEAVQNIADADQNRCAVPIASQSPDDGVVTAENITDREKTGHNRKTAPNSNLILDFSCPLHSSGLSLMMPIGVEPPRTRVPRSTVASVPAGKSTSTRDPNRMSPMSSPFPTVSPTFFQHTIRRATNPAICVKTSFISP